MSDVNVAIQHPNIEASRVEGTEVYNRAGERLGTVEDLVIGKQDGQVKYAIMAFGGFLGIGERQVAYPLDQISFQRTAAGDLEAYVGTPADQIQNLPEYTGDAAGAGAAGTDAATGSN